jgi:hypothetical protein
MKKPPSLASMSKQGLKRYVSSKGSTDSEYDRARHALEYANDALERRKKVTLPSVWRKGGK